MAGFVNIALIQFDFDARDIPIVVLMGFGVTNALTVGSLCVQLAAATHLISR